MTPLPDSLREGELFGPGGVVGGMAQVNRRVLEWIYFLVGCVVRPCFLTLFPCKWRQREWKDARSLNIGLLAQSVISLWWWWSVTIYSRQIQILLTTVLLSWGYVIYATRLAAQWQLKEDYPMQTHNF